MPVLRALSPSEWLFVPGGIRLAAWGRHDERIDTAALAAAMAALAVRHPLLGARIEPTAAGWEFRRRTAPPTPVVRPRGARVQDELARAVAPTADTLQAAVLPDDDADTLVLVLHHAVADHASTAALVAELSDLYATASHGPPRQPELTGATPPPLEAALGATGFTREDLADYASRRRRIAVGVDVAQLPHRGGTGPTGYGVEELAFGERATAELAEAARRGRISVHALACGAVLAAARTMFPGPTEATVPLVCHRPVDMRRRLRIPRQTQVFAASGHHAVLHLAAHHGAVHAGRQISAEFHDAVRAGALELEVLALERLLEQTPLQITAGVTDLGRYPRADTPTGSPDPKPLVTGGLPQVPAPFPVIATSVVHGRLQLSAPYFHSWFDPEVIKQFMAHTRNHLDAARAS